MLEENKNNEESDFKDFDDSVSDNIELDNDLSAIDEDKVEQALKNVVSQMMSEPSEPQENKESDADSPKEQTGEAQSIENEDSPDKKDERLQEEKQPEEETQEKKENNATEELEGEKQKESDLDNTQEVEV